MDTGTASGASKVPSINQFISVSLQDEITEEDIDDSFKSMFAQLAGEVKYFFLYHMCPISYCDL